jgi:hypothetical protein
MHRIDALKMHFKRRSRAGKMCVAIIAIFYSGNILVRGAPGGGLRRGPEWSLMPGSLKVDYSLQPLAIDRLDPTFSWAVAAAEGVRGAVTTGYTLTVTELGQRGEPSRSWMRTEQTNRTTFVDLPAGARLASDTAYDWSV